MTKTYRVDVNKNGDRHWYNENNVLHREDGPAIELVCGGKAHYYLNGKEYDIGLWSAALADMRTLCKYIGEQVILDGKRYRLVEDK